MNKTNEIPDFGAMLDRMRHLNYGNLSFKVVCPICGEPVKPDESMTIDTAVNFPKPLQNATCKLHGRVMMPFDGWIMPRESR